ncbi:TetR family transcriptional regulator C-terminal domain-containing protein [Flavobacteriaceae bacterium]|nr:TetR family transcriptional regulator C-terminal domain-containing protein [Flavobacteriaceae bacterium]MDA9016092.1 TetR family transcriptional regulator C-terminal domain-containing protein [Flavobacteriaceae bacterium]MDB3862577.1 TetR family transcriptional regulator C-terminal domain-containing protein [Flavobacteriaceae bacterium]MDC3354831.1 TetR family transcriptional regulator C-terminal domain-containing protein [Flavobacteriaceae bacterium]
MQQKIFEYYTNYVLEHEKEPTSVYRFCKNLKIKESEFYKHFASLEHLKGQIFSEFFNNAISLIQKEKGYVSKSPQEKLLSFYYTFFEVLLLNRSYVLFALGGGKSPMDKMAILKPLRSTFKQFATVLIQDGNALKQSKISQHPEAVFSEGAWIQLMFLLKFWMEDSSPGFEKTDMAIEKSVRTVFDLFDSTPFDSIIDFGKFLWKEKFNMA